LKTPYSKKQRNQEAEFARSKIKISAIKEGAVQLFALSEGNKNY
jgi:hypothetical protein